MAPIQYNLVVDSAGLQLIWGMLGKAPAENSRVLMNALEGQVADQEAAYAVQVAAQQTAIDKIAADQAEAARVFNTPPNPDAPVQPNN